MRRGKGRSQVLVAVDSDVGAEGHCATGAPSRDHGWQWQWHGTHLPLHGRPSDDGVCASVAPTLAL